MGLFFGTRGYLGTQGWDRTRRLRTVARHRVVRIWTALAVLVVVLVVVLGPLTTTLETGVYFRDPQTAQFGWKNLTLFGGVEFLLPGVFAANPISKVDGSLWTLPFEVWGYAALGFLGAVGLLHRRWVAPVLFGVAVLVFRFPPTGEMTANIFRRNLSVSSAAGFAAFFLAVAAVAALRVEVRPGRFITAGVALFAGAIVLG